MVKISLVLTMLFALIPIRADAVHDYTEKVSCYDCHRGLPFKKIDISFNEGTDKICSSCHKVFHETAGGFSHPVNVHPSMSIPPDMPLDPTGGITCITCHSYHSGFKDSAGNKKFFLRRTPGKVFCYSCHNKRLF